MHWELRMIKMAIRDIQIKLYIKHMRLLCKLSFKKGIEWSYQDKIEKKHQGMLCMRDINDTYCKYILNTYAC